MRQAARGHHIITQERRTSRWQSCPICKIHMGGNGLSPFSEPNILLSVYPLGLRDGFYLLTFACAQNNNRK